MSGSASPEPPRAIRRLTLRNVRDASVTVVLEPWAGEYDLGPRQVLEIVEEGGEPAENLEIQVEASHVLFHARSGSILRAFRDGVELP